MKKILSTTRQNIIDIIRDGFQNPTSTVQHDYYDSGGRKVEEYKISYHGRLSEIDFLHRIYDLEKLPSTDRRYENAEGDIIQHTVNNDDWGENWIFFDNRFELKNGTDEVLLKFLCEMFNPFVRDDSQPWREFLRIINELLGADGYELYETSHISGRAVYGWREIAPNSLIVPQNNSINSFKLKFIGEGSYACVYRYWDNFYQKFFVLKRARKDLDEKENARFKQEYEQTKKLSSQYIVEVYGYDDANREYTMESMDCTLDKYIQDNGGKLTINKRVSIASRIVQAFRFIHSKGLLHRDISPKNILVKKWGDRDVFKVSDFGLVKVPESQLTTANTEFKGYFNDPLLRLEGFAAYSMSHEIYSITMLVFFILTGRTNPSKIENSSLEELVKRGLDPDKSKRYSSLDELLEDLVKIR